MKEEDVILIECLPEKNQLSFRNQNNNNNKIIYRKDSNLRDILI